MNGERNTFNTISSVPSEILGPLPRNVAICSDDARYLLTVVLITILGPLLGLGVYSLSELRNTQQRALLRSNGRDVAGEVTGLKIARGGVTDVEYSFVVDGSKYHGKARVPKHTDVVLNTSDQIRIRYIPSNPTINHPSAWEWSAFMGLDKAAFSLCFIGFGWIAFLMLYRERTLAREGKAVEGVVKGCAPRNREYQVEYRFRPENGEEVDGRCYCKDSYEAGDSVWILYLPMKPKRNHSYPLSLYRVVE